MTLLIFSGLLYLVGISVVLVLKPQLMFAKDGTWKEFGLGRNKSKYTWMPFWLFAIMWAIISYIIVLIVASTFGVAGVQNKTEIVVPTEVIEPENVSIKSLPPSIKKKPSSLDEMKPGYYILDANETVKRGVPKYIYLGPEAPNLIYNNSVSESD
jgi:hypothetical protein